MDWKRRADELIDEFNACLHARPKTNAVDVQLEKDICARAAYELNTQRSWGDTNDIKKACQQLETRLQHLKEKLVFEILKNGAV